MSDQQAFFKALREQVGALKAERAPEKVKAQIESIRATLKRNAQIARFVGEPGAGWDPFPSQVEKVETLLQRRRLDVQLTVAGKTSRQNGSRASWHRIGAGNGCGNCYTGRGAAGH